MDYTKFRQGWIYCIKNKVNEKLYIGKTLDFTSRKWQHFHREKGPILKRAYAKYGIENFEMYPILTFVAVNKEVCNKILVWFEKYYIDKFDTFKNGYNATKGGDGLCGYSHSEEYKASMSKKQKEYKAQEWVKEKDRKRMLGNRLSDPYKKPIIRYNIDGEYIKEYDCIVSAINDIIKEGQHTINWRSIHSNIIRALGNKTNRQHCNKAYNCLWRYKEADNYPLTIEPYRRHGKEKPVFHYTKEGILIASYRTLREAATKENKTVQEIQYLSFNGDLRRRENRACRKDYWSRIAPSSNESCQT